MKGIYGYKKDNEIYLSGNLLEKEIDGKKYSIVYDGAIYNLDNIKAVIGKEDYISDSELLLDLYIDYKEKMLTNLNGDFSFAIYAWEKNFYSQH